MVRWLFLAVFSLAAVGPSTSAVRLWDGGAGPSANSWLTPANWVGDVAPVPGDRLAFPAEAAGVLSSNDFPPNTAFHSLLLSNTYHFVGASITLSSGITVFSTDDAHLPAFWLPITLAAAQSFSTRTRVWSGLRFLAPIDTQGHELTLSTFGTNDIIELNDTIRGAGSIRKTGPGHAYLLSAGNTYSGITHVRDGTIHIAGGTALGSSASGTIVDATAEVALRPGPFTVNEPLTLSGKLSGGGNSVWTAPIHLPGAIAQIAATNGPFAIRGQISGPGGLFVPLGHPLLLDAPVNTYQGRTEIGGHVVINAHQPQSDVLFTGTYLGGSGSIGNVTTTGPFFKSVAPGTNSVGTLTTRNLALDNRTTVTFNVNGAPGAVSNSIQVNGLIDLANAKLLVFSRSLSSTSHQQFTLIGNDGTDPVIGTFLNLPEGALVVSNTAWLRITYRGGPDSNDVVLYPGTPPNPYWDGGGNDNFWTTPANWIGDAAPQPGDALVFPRLDDRSTNFNDFPAGTTFHSIYINTEAVFEGKAVSLDAGLKVYDNAEIFFPLRLNAPQTFFVDDDGSLIISGGIDNGGHGLTIYAEGFFTEIRSGISGLGGLILDGYGYIYLSHASTYSGRTELRNGELHLLHPQALGSIEGDTFVGTNGHLSLAAGLSIAEPLILAGSLYGSGSYVGPINTVSGRLVLEQGEVLQISGPISGGDLTILGAGTTILSGTNTHTGQTLLWGGTLFVNGSQPSSTILLEGILGGIGRVGPITGGRVFGSTLSPGNNTIGTLTAGDVALNPYATLALTLNGTSPAAYDRLQVNGSLQLDNASLRISLGFAPAPEDSFIVIENDGADAIQGNFLFLPEGAALDAAGHQLRISYTGGDGNDVVLTVAPPLTNVRIWDGGGTDGFWSTAANWVGDVPPQSGDYLGFPVNAARKINTNDLPAGTTFGALTLSGAGYYLHGQSITLLDGIADVTTISGGNRILLPIILGADQTFSTAIELLLGQRIETGQNTLTVAGNSLIITGVVAGAGTVVKRGSGVVHLFGANTYSGPTDVMEGHLRIHHLSALGTPGAPTIVRAGAALITATLNRASRFMEPVVLAGWLSCDAGIWAGPVETVSSNAMLSGDIEGLISGSGGVVAHSRLTLFADNTYTGATLNTNATLTIHGHQPQSPILQIGGWLAGSGRVGPVTALGGSIAPGYSSNLVLTTGDLNIRRPATFRAGVFWTPSSNDRVRVLGSVNLEQPSLVFYSFYNLPTVGQAFTIIDNDGADPIVGTFAGWPESGYKVLTNGVFQITYSGGDGNDVVITRTHPPPATILSLNVGTGSTWLTARGLPFTYYTLEATTSLLPPVQWTRIDTSWVAHTNGSFTLSEYSPPTNSMRFYRIRSGF